MKHLRYLRYLVRHKWFVAVAGRMVGVSWWRLLIHDWSKFLPSEWFPYAEYFYGTSSGKHAFRVAWLKHQNRQPHHWQYWILYEDSAKRAPLVMPAADAREMVADWAGAGRAICGEWDLVEWYGKNRHLISLAPRTQIDVQDLVTGWLQRHGAEVAR